MMRLRWFSFFLCLFALPVLAAPKVEVTALTEGQTAWLVADRSAPVVTVTMAWRNRGSLIDPADKPGLVSFAVSLLDEGAGDLDSAAFQGRLEDLGASISFSAGSETLGLTIRSLTADLPEVIGLARLALSQPRFDPAAVERVRGQLRQSYARSLENGGALAGNLFSAAVYAGHPLAVGDRQRLAALDTITREELAALVPQRFTRAGLVIAAAGAVDAEELKRQLAPLLAVLPAGSPPAALPPALPQAAGQTLVLNRPLPQSTILFAMPSVARLHPDYLPSALLAHVLGGGSFTSRLKDSVREQKGLAYGISAGVSASDVSSLLSGSSATANDKAAEAVATIRETLEAVRQNGITAQELAAAQDYLAGSLPIRLDSTRQIAGTLLALQLDGLPPTYLDTREADIRAVSLDQVNRLARQLLDPARQTFIVVGQPAGLAATTALPEGF